jgi:CDP-diglyceride synthetase
MRPEPLTSKELFFLEVILGAFLCIAVVLRILIYLMKKNVILVKIFSKFYKFFLTIGFVGFILLFFTYEQINLLGSYFWYLFLLIGSLIWFGFILFFLIKKVPLEKRELEKKKRFLKYLPK